MLFSYCCVLHPHSHPDIAPTKQVLLTFDVPHPRQILVSFVRPSEGSQTPE